MKKKINLLIVKASPNSDGCGNKIMLELERFVKKELNCKVSIFDQQKESLRRNEKYQMICDGKKMESKFEKKLMACDGIILLSPVYLKQAPGEFKITLDQFAYRMNEFPLIGKKMVSFVYCDTNGAKELNQYYKNIFSSAGVEFVGTCDYYRAFQSLDENMSIFKEDIQTMYRYIRNDVFHISDGQERLFQIYKEVIQKEQEKGIEVHRHKRWNLLNQYDSLYDYVKSTM
ncbi:MAG: flavodoxin family protein [Lachnospiraceae bacterium]|nr:flavodoxin family protein [Lachnospiraceae bacterium]